MDVARELRTRIDCWDRAAFGRVASTHSPTGDAVLPRLTRLADHSKLWVGLAVALAATRRRRPRRAAARGLGSIAVASFTANQIGKRLARRERPAVTDVPLRRLARRRPTSGSFPSGHSASAAAFAAGVALEMPELALPLAALGAAVGYSRVYSGVHYPSDVLAGAAVGFAAAAAVARLVPLPDVRSTVTDSPPIAGQAPRPTGSGIVALVNPRSGRDGDDAVAQLLRDELPDAEIVELEDGDDLEETLERAAARAEVIAMAGGDGSLNIAAQVAMKHDLPLLVLPAGTFNHFAGDLGVSTPGAAIGAVQRGEAVRIDVGQVRASTPDGSAPIERCFLNTASVGAYPEFVASREQWEGRLGKPVAAVLATVRVLRTFSPPDVDVDGTRRRMGLAFIGSNEYEPHGFAPGWRPDLAEGNLDVRLLDLSRRVPRTRFALAVLFGRIRRSHQYLESHPRELTVTLPGPDRLSVDGEVLEVGTTLRFSMDRSALTVFRPSAPTH